jgi:anti-sigma B factor antagonist
VSKQRRHDRSHSRIGLSRAAYHARPQPRYVSLAPAWGRHGTGDDVGMKETESTDFGVETIDGGGSVGVIAVHGQADLHTAPELRSAITTALDGGATGLVIDLSEATFIDSMTLGVLLGAVKRLRPAGGKVGIVCTDSHIRRIFEITLLDRVFSLHDDRDGALAFAGGGP